MTLPWNERMTMMLMPRSLYYRRRIADEATWGEHELNVLGDILAPGGTAVDVGANQGVFAFAFARHATRVVAFEPNPDYAAFAQRMLGSRARVHAVALSNSTGEAEFIVPVSKEGWHCTSGQPHAGRHGGGRRDALHRGGEDAGQLRLRTCGGEDRRRGQRDGRAGAAGRPSCATSLC
jgi:hypothetical protein